MFHGGASCGYCRFERGRPQRGLLDAGVSCILADAVASAILIELEEGSGADVLGVLAAVETYRSANEIRSVRIQLDGRSYMLAPSG
jgi:hypothetical protein